MTTSRLISDTTAADFLTSPKTRHLLSPFMEQARSMAEAAALLEMKFPALHRRVRQMVKLGLLEVTYEETRTGHLIKFYRTTSHEFIVPLEATPSTDLETFIGDGFRDSVTLLSRGVAKTLEAGAPRWASGCSGRTMCFRSWPHLAKAVSCSSRQPYQGVAFTATVGCT